MTTNTKQTQKALRMALEALEVATTPLAKDRQEVLRAITAIREALAEQPAPVAEPHEQQEPVAVAAWNLSRMTRLLFDAWRKAEPSHNITKYPESYMASFQDMARAVLYASPQASKPWVGLTQQDINIAFDDTQEGGGFDDFARAIEAKLRERNEHWEKNA